MCGIFCLVCKGIDKIESDSSFNLVREALVRRGPDCFDTKLVHLKDDWYGFFAASVLWTQGPDGPTRQPLTDENGNILLWNGDIYSGLGDGVRDPSVDNDAKMIFSTLKEEEFTDVLTQVSGPYSFVLWEPAKGRLCWGRDPIGRHSLVWDIAPTRLLISSISDGCCQEVPACGIFSTSLIESDIGLNIYPWAHLEHNCGLEDEVKMNAEVQKRITHCNFTYFERPKENDSLLPEKVPDGFLNKGIVTGPPLANLDRLLSNSNIHQKVSNLEHLLSVSVRLRVLSLPPVCRDCRLPIRLECCQHVRLAVLFSGGLDSTILALLAHRSLPHNEPIDLYNVAFESPRTSNFRVPDRITAESSLSELKSLAPDRLWNLVEINVTQEELCRLRSEQIKQLIYPLDSVLDDSLGCALWFAARGEGTLNGEFYRSPARIVLLGMGADELFGGYSRHRRTLKAKGWTELGRELEMELWSISRRNLGRDNRIVADHGRQPRAPFLDEGVVKFALGLPPWEKCCPTPEMAPGLGDKLLLRLVARHVGLEGAATLPKRALQFGSRIANPKEKGHQKSQRLKQNCDNEQI